LALLAIAFLVIPALGDSDPVMPLTDTWVKLDQFMPVGGFFTGPWTWTSGEEVQFSITDWLVASDQFKMFDFGKLVLTTPKMPDWDALGAAGPFVSPPWTDNPDVAFNSGFFSTGEILFAPGSHAITIQDIHIPPVTKGGGPFTDGTVAFKASPVPEPGTLSLLGIGGLALLRRLRGKS